MDADGDCFLCNPDPDLVYASAGEFFAMLGWGPIGEGYSLIATTAHARSMMDLDSSEAESLVRFTREVRAILSRHYGDCVITEHGRVAACVEAAASQHEPHCLHAHRLVFPGLSQIDLKALAPQFEWTEWPSFMEAYREFEWPGQYLCAEFSSGHTAIAAAGQPIPRQYFRSLASVTRGRGEPPDWRAEPNLSVVQAAKRTLAT